MIFPLSRCTTIDHAMYYPFSQAQLWDYIGDAEKWPEFIDRQSLYLPPTLVEASDTHWTFHAGDGQWYKFHLERYTPGLELSLNLVALDSLLPIANMAHDIILELGADNGTNLYWSIYLELYPANEDLSPGEGIVAALRRWYLLRDFRLPMLQMALESSYNLYNLLTNKRLDDDHLAKIEAKERLIVDS